MAQPGAGTGGGGGAAVAPLAPKPKYPANSRRSCSTLSNVGRDTSILSVKRRGGMTLSQEEFCQHA